MTTVDYPCPYCSKTYRGPIGYHNLETHVRIYHSDKQAEFQGMPKSKIERFVVSPPEPRPMREQPQSQPQQPIIQIVQPPPQQQPIIQPPVQEFLDTQQFQQRLEEQPMPLREVPLIPVQQIQQQQPMVQPLTKPQFPQLQQVPPPEEKEEETRFPPYLMELPPHEWLESFLKYYNCDKLFIKIQVDNVLLTKQLPTTSTLMNDLKQMKSGHTHLTMIQYIGNMYEHMLREYLKKREEMRYTPRTGVSLGGSFEPRGGIPIFADERTHESVPFVRTAPPSFAEDRVARLEDELRRREEQDRRNMEAKLQELTLKLDQAQTLQEDPRIRELQENMKQMSEGNRLLQQQLEQQRMENLRREIDDIKNLALMNKGLEPEKVQQMIDQRVREARGEIDARHELEQLVEQKLASRAGTTQADVDMKKAELELELGMEKIKAESDKTEMIGKTISDVAGVFGEGLGRGLASKTQPPQGQAQQPATGGPGQPSPNIKNCPYNCGTQLIVEPGTRYGECPNCKGKIEMDPFGNPHRYEPYEPIHHTQITQKQPQTRDKEPEEQATSTVTVEESGIPEKEPYVEPEQTSVIDYTVKTETTKPDEKKKQPEEKTE